MSNVLANKLRQVDLLTREQATKALNSSSIDNVPFIITLQRLEIHKEDFVLEKIKEEFNFSVNYQVLRELKLSVAQRLTLSFSKNNNVISYDEDEGHIYVAVLDPFDRQMLELTRLQLRTGKKVVPVLVRFDDMMEMLSRLQAVSEDIGETVEEIDKTIEVDWEAENISNRVDSAPLVKMVDGIVIDAFRNGASDIHIEPEEKITNVRFRVDGSLYLHRTIEKEQHNLVCSRLKIISGLDPSNRNTPQDGSFRYKAGYISVDLRVSVLPTANGEKIVLRLLGADKEINYDLNSLGLRPYVIETLEKAIRVPNGIILVTGPTGSGKTTTLYTILNKLATPDTSLVTVEDPVERNIEGVSQVQVANKAGLGFAESLRSILRQDPDTIMIGEMRDQETAQIATRAAITGHLVLSTIHTNDAISTVSRLIDMGVEPYMISSSLKCVIAQRLVKKVCPSCKIEHVNTDIEKDLIKISDSTSWEGSGCQECNHTGYRGRTAVFEILEVDGELARLIAKNADMETLVAHVAKKGTRTMRQEILELMDQGLTSIEEAVKILYTIE